jgi:hypothetical protein
VGTVRVFNIGGQIIETVKYGDDVALMPKEETALQGMIEKLIKIGICYGMELKVNETEVLRISRHPSSVTITIGQKQLEHVKSFKYLGSILTNDGRYMRETKFRIGMTNAEFSKKIFFTSKLDFKLRKKLQKCYIWSLALYCAETGTLRAVDQKYLESFEMWCWRRVENISWTDHVGNKEVLLNKSP